MADNLDIALKIQVNGTEKEIKNLKDLRQARKDLTSAFIAGDQEAIKSLAVLNDKLEDLGEATNTVKGSGVERLTSSFALLGQGIATFDIDKIKTGFQGLGAAMKAVPIFLLIEGVRLLIENFDEVISFFKSFIGATESSEIAAKKLTDQLVKQAEAIKDLQKGIDDYTKFALLSAQKLGASEDELANITIKSYLKKFNAAKEYYAETVKIYNALVKNEESTKDKREAALKQVNEAKEAAKQIGYDLYNFNEQLSIKRNQEIEKAFDDEIAKDKAKADKLKAQRDAALAAQLKENKRQNDELAKLDAAGDELNKQRIDYQKEYDQSIIDSNNLFNQLSAEQDATAAKSADERRKLNEQVAASRLSMERNAFQGAKDLSAAFFQFQINAAGDNAKKQDELARKAFAVNKGLQLAQGALEGYRSVLSTYASTPGGPIIKGAAAAIAGIASAGMLLKIASVQYKGATATDAGTSGVGSSSTFSAPPPPPQISDNGGQVGSTIINNNGPTGPLYALAVESQFTKVQKNVRRLSEQATWG